MKRPFGLRGQESGQGTIEYILVLLIAVILIGGLIYQFNTAFRNYAEAFFGGYIACLLEVGELPGSSNGECQMADFDLASGEQVVADGGSGGGGGSGSGSGAGGKGAQGKAGDEGNNSEGEGGGDSGGGGRSELASSGGGGGGMSSRPIGSLRSRQRSTPVGTVAGADKDSAIESNGVVLNSGGNSTAIGSLSDNRRQGRRTIIIGYGYYDPDGEGNNENRPAVANMGKRVDENATLRPKKSVVNLDRKPAQSSEMEEKEMSFGDFIRYLFIAAIVLAIVIFFGGQAMQISKSWEK